MHIDLADLCLQIEDVDASNDPGGDGGEEPESNKDIFEIPMRSNQSPIRFMWFGRYYELQEH